MKSTGRASKICARGPNLYPEFTQDLAVGNTVLVDDGLLGMTVTRVTQDKAVCKVLNNGDLGENKGVNLPVVSIALPALAEKDKRDLIFGFEQGGGFYRRLVYLQAFRRTGNS